jgi:hypothetical protein
LSAFVAIIVSALLPKNNMTSAIRLLVGLTRYELIETTRDFVEFFNAVAGLFHP